jgi:transcriptional regulator with XRE-family HTH domain
MSKKFGKLLRTARLGEGLNQADVAKKVGVTQATISNWEAGQSEPEGKVLDKLGRLFGDLGGSANNGAASGALSDVGAFGEWLRGEREKQGLTVGELADSSGVTAVTIYNLESGRSKNPQSASRSKLEDALKVKVPEDVKQEVSEQSEIEGLGQLVDFNPFAEEELPTCAGVYVFYDVSERPIYVGKARRIADRVKDHKEKFWFRQPVVTNAAYVKINDQKLRHQVEQIMIKFLKKNAVINKQSVDRDETD